MRHPCEGADPHGQLRHLVMLWMRRARRRSPTTVVAELLSIGSDSGPRYMQSHQLQLLWIYSICGVGPFYARGGLGWDAMIATLACLLGHGTVVLAASPNDNGLMHQEFVDFDLPAGLGWSRPARPGGTNNMSQCLQPFPFAKADKREGSRAVAHRRRELRDHWQRSEKFLMPQDDTTDFVLPARAAGKALACKLRFGNGADIAGDVDACQLTPADEESQPTAKKACYAWCDGAMTQAASAASLLQVALTPAAALSSKGPG